ncbi:hypothetical protein [Arenibacter sp. S6351L]|jgi:hypothetical protein|uniref:hypothetical protein n=1 Tax=Arenibacter sp. S6351L TaxID=2926407 RepID=UPI001FF57997|nr:hypothetical protein [Arenibacter sp. S6351L]MBU2907547.1 hypothetical protein [Arenibacter algicola]MCK0133369.1 hypothetical protein [Arenibacter sp. S6351L]|tara:strand:- start:356 stop:544 length:189 start_codon:yes stop_codon:yes gene_type:complete
MRYKVAQGIISFVILTLVGCTKEEECTRIDKIGGGLLHEQEIEVPCDFPEPKPLGTLPNQKI